MRHDSTDYVFTDHHYAACVPARHEGRTKAAVVARAAVQDKLIELEGRLSPKPERRGLWRSRP